MPIWFFMLPVGSNTEYPDELADIFVGGLTEVFLNKAASSENFLPSVMTGSLNEVCIFWSPVAFSEGSLDSLESLLTDDFLSTNFNFSVLFGDFGWSLFAVERLLGEMLKASKEGFNVGREGVISCVEGYVLRSPIFFGLIKPPSPDFEPAI